MPHILAGDWRSFVVENGTPRPDQSFHLEINDAGQVLAGSTHGGAAVKGTASPANSEFHHIFIDKPAPRKKYRGFLLVSGPQLILVGVINRNPLLDGLEEGLTTDKIANLFDQQQEVWIATKP